MSVNSSSNQKQLLDELSKGSERAFTDLYNRYKNVVYSCALKITKSRTLSEEVVQDVFLKIWLKKETLTDIAHFESYIFVVARNHIFSMLKQIAKENTLKSKFNYNDISLDLTDASLEEEQFTSLLNEIIKQLPPQQQKVYRMAKEEDLNYQQIGELLNISAMTAKKHLAQALKFIRIKLTNHIDLILLGCFFTQN